MQLALHLVEGGRLAGFCDGYRIDLPEHAFLARATNQLRRNSPVAKDIAPICTKFRGGIDES